MLTEEQQRVLNLVKQGHNIYIGGQAGTGKSYLLTRIYDKLTSLGKNVSVTCTTGIACTHFPPRCNATTIHSWSGMDDGRHESHQICSLLLNNIRYKNALTRIISCDVLILDEVSMLSKKLFEQLSIICSLKNDSYSFGNIQLVFCGDFLQLPPVKNILYNEDGQFCFMSPIFDKVFRHKIFLKEIKRQQDAVFIKTINQVSLGQMSEEINEYIKTFERPLHSVYGDDRKNSVKLFATNELVDMYNRKCILDLHGELFEYRANDTGDVSKLRKILAPPVLWLKRNCQVILLRNISKKLVNGLIGQVIACEQDGPVVYFPQIAVSTKLQKIPFSGMYVKMCKDRNSVKSLKSDHLGPQ